MPSLQERVAEFMGSLGFRWFMNSWVWARLDNSKDNIDPGTFTSEEATFFYKQSVEARKNQLKELIYVLDTPEYRKVREILETKIAELDQLLKEEGESNVV